MTLVHLTRPHWLHLRWPSRSELRSVGRKARWAGVRAGIAVVASYVAYLVVINLLLVTGLAKPIINLMDPDHVRFDYASAYSVWFASFHTKGFAVRGTDTAVEWRITSDEASATIAVTDLLQRRLRLGDAKAKGVTVRIRMKVTAPTAEYLAKLPPIEGFPDPPIKPPEKPPLSDAEYNLWSVLLEEGAAEDIREVWVDTIHFTDPGASRAAGAFYFEPMRVVRVDPSEYVVGSGAVDIGTSSVATDIHGTFRLHVTTIDPRTIEDAKALANVDATALASARLADLAWLDAVVGPSVALAGGGGPLEVAAEVRAGVIEPGSRFDLRSEGWTAWRGRNGGTGTSLVHASVPMKTPSLSVVRVESYEVDAHHDKERVVHAPAMGIVLTFDNTDLAKSFAAWKLHVDVPSATVPKLEALNGYFDTPYLYGGSARLGARGDADPAGASGTLETTLSNFAMQAGKSVVKGGGTVELTLRRFDFGKQHGDFSLARFDLRDMSAGTQTGYWVNGSASPFTVSLGDAGTSFEASVSGKARDAQLPLVVADASGLVRTLVGGQGFTYTARLRLTPTVIELADVRAVGDHLDLYGHYRADGRGKNGAALVFTPVGNMGLELRKGDLTVHPWASKRWYATTL